MMRNADTCRKCYDAAKPVVAHHAPSGEQEIRMLVVPAAIDSAQSAAAAVAAVAAAKQEALGASVAATVAAINMLRGTASLKLTSQDFVRGNSERAARKRNFDAAPAAAAASSLSPPHAKQPKIAREDSPNPIPSTNMSSRDGCAAPLGQDTVHTHYGGVYHHHIRDPHSFRRGRPDLYFWYRYGWPVLRW